ncbi:MAG: TRAP transporter substrate-binding protein [Inquilinaceae bacterium]
MFRNWFAAAALGLGIAAAPALAQTTIKVATFVPEQSVGVSKVIKPWMEAVQADLGDQVTMQPFWGGTLGKDPFKQFELVRNGVADVTWVLPGYTAGQFPQMSVFELPFLFRDATEASVVGWKLYEQGLLTGLEDVHLVGFFASEPSNVFMKEGIGSLDDLKGMKLRSVGPIHAQWLEIMGAAPQTLSSAEMNEGLNRGTIDGVIQSWSGMRTFKTLELVSQNQEVPIGVIPFLLVMNKDTWENLPADVQASIMAHGAAAMARSAGEAYGAVGAEIREGVVAEGRIDLQTPDAEALARYREMAQPVYVRWVEETPNGEAVLAAAMKEIEAYRKMN